MSFQLLTQTSADPPVFQLTCVTTSSPPTTVLWTLNGSPVNGSNYTSSQIVVDRPKSTYNNTLTVTGRVSGMYTCTVTTTCSPVCGATGFTLNPRSVTSSITVQGEHCPLGVFCAPIRHTSMQLLLPHPLVSLLYRLVQCLLMSLGLHQTHQAL